MSIIGYIPIGHKNAISRTQLSIRSGYPDRKCRNMIAEARDQGEIILNTGGGYFRYGGKEDDIYLNAYLQRESHRFYSIGKTHRKLRKAHRKNNQIEGQLSFKVE